MNHAGVEGWTSTASAQDVARRLGGARRVVVLTHLKPDGDAVGSSIALTRALNAGASGKRAEAWYAGPLPGWLKDVAGDTPYRVIGAEGPPESNDPDAIAIVDTGSWSQLEPVEAWVRKRTDATLVVDHHVQGDADVARARLLDTRAASACQPVGEVCRLLVGAPDLGSLPEELATPLYLGLASDTGWFRHSNVNERVMHAAGELLRAGARHVWLYQTVEQRDTPARLRLLSRALSTLELAPFDDAGRCVAFLSLSTQDFADCKAEPGESGGFVDYPMTIAEVMVTALLTDASSGGRTLTKISLRSKEHPASVDVNAIARALGGGGHVRAAGARCPQGLAETRRVLLDAIRAQARGRGA